MCVCGVQGESTLPLSLSVVLLLVGAVTPLALPYLQGEHLQGEEGEGFGHGCVCMEDDLGETCVPLQTVCGCKGAKPLSSPSLLKVVSVEGTGSRLKTMEQRWNSGAGGGSLYA